RLMPKQYLKRVLSDSLRQSFGADLRNLVTIGKDEAVIENDNLKVMISSEGDVEAAIKNDINVNIPIEFHPTSSGLCITNIAPGERVIHIGSGDRNCVRGSLASMVIYLAWLRLLSDGLTPMAFASTERVAVFSLFNAINSYVFSPAASPQVKPLVLDSLRWEPFKLKFKERFSDVTYVRDEKGLRTLIKEREVEPSLISSGVHQLAIVEMLVNNPILKSIIIEEPEIYLHADLQIEVAKDLTRVDKRLFITSHSEWFTMAFALARTLADKDVKVY
ncbi:MAG: hypothetical protein ACP5H1_08470, partial [Acidilobus sp.]